MWVIIEQWLKNKIQRKEIADYLVKENIQSVVIYGAGKIGELLYDDLQESGLIEVQCFIDKNADSLYYGIDDMEIYNLDELQNVKKVDAIIITPYKYYEQIKNDIQRKLLFETKYIAIDDIIWRVE